MRDRLGIVAGTVLALGAVGVLLGAYQVQGKTMPGWLFWSVVVSGAIIFSVTTLVWLWVVAIIPARTYLQRRTFRWPLPRKDAPDPNQWLLDIAREDADNPARHLMILSQTISNMDLRQATRRPWVELSFSLYNGGVHNILVGPISGHAKYKGDELDECIDVPGQSRKPRGHIHPLKIRVYVPKDEADNIYKEIATSRQVRSLSLTGVRLDVRAECPDAKTVPLNLGLSDIFRAKD